MEKFCILILVAFFVTNSLDKAETVQLEELEDLPLQTFDELFVEEWLDKDEAEDLNTPPTNFGQNVHHQIDRQNTQIGQIEPNSTDQNPHLTASDKRKIIDEFLAIKDEFKQKGKYSVKEWVLIDGKIAKHLKANRKKIYEWKKEFGLSRKMHNFGKKKEKRKHLVEKFDQMKAELKRDGIKNSYKNELDKTVAKELGLNFKTIYNWKRELGQTTQNKYSHRKELMKCYYEIKDKNPKIRDENIAKMMKIGIATLVRWKRQFKRQQFNPNSFGGQFVEENDAENVQQIGH